MGDSPAFVLVDAREHGEWRERYFKCARTCGELDPKLAEIMDNEEEYARRAKAEQGTT